MKPMQQAPRKVTIINIHKQYFEQIQWYIKTENTIIVFIIVYFKNY